MAALRYRTSFWARLRDDERTESDRGFMRHLRDCAREKQIAFQRLMSAYQGNPIGIECKSRTRDAWAFVLPDMSGGAAFRIQYFDVGSFSGHTEHDTLLKAVESMLGEGYMVADPGALDRLSATHEWAVGVKRSEVRLRFNQGKIDFPTMLTEMAAIT